MPNDPNEIGALWIKDSKNGTRYLDGKVNGEAVVVFKNKFKKDGSREPDYRIYKSQPRGERQPVTAETDDLGF